MFEVASNPAMRRAIKAAHASRAEAVSPSMELVVRKQNLPLIAEPFGCDIFTG